MLFGLGVVTWVLNPYATLLVLGALHLWLLLVDPELRPRPGAALALVALALMPLGLLIAFYARELGVGPGGIAWDAVLALAGGHVGLPAMVLWSLGFGCVRARPRWLRSRPRRPGWVTVRRSRFAVRCPMLVRDRLVVPSRRCDDSQAMSETLLTTRSSQRRASAAGGACCRWR